MFRIFFSWSLVVLLAVAAPLVLAHEDHGPKDHVAQDIDVTISVKSFGSAELNMEILENETIEWSVAAKDDALVYVDLHTHDERGTINYYNESDISDTDTQQFTAPEDGTYSIYVTRGESTGATVVLKAKGTFAVVGTLGFELGHEEESPGLGPVVSAVLVVVVATFLARRRT